MDRIVISTFDNRDLTRYSTLIDTNQTWFNIFAYMACANATSNDQSTVEVHFANKRKIYGNYPVHGNSFFINNFLSFLSFVD